MLCSVLDLSYFLEDNEALYTHKHTVVCSLVYEKTVKIGTGSYVASSQLASKSFRLQSQGTAGWWLLHCFLTLLFVILFPPFLPTAPVVSFSTSSTVFFPFLLNLNAHFCVSSSSHQSAVPTGGFTGVYCRRLPPCAALGRARQQRTQGHLPHYNPLLARPAVCSRLDKTHAHSLTQNKRAVLILVDSANRSFQWLANIGK